MNQKPTCAVIGGGVAGLSAAVFLTKAGFKVTLLEASPKLGGRAYSFFDKTLNREIDNGQHIMASWYRETFEYLNTIGSLHKLTFQESLVIDFADLNGTAFRLKCPKLFAPLNLLYGLMSFDALDFSDKMAAIRLVRKIKAGSFNESALKSMNTAELFETENQTANLIRSFWKPFVIAVFNAELHDTSAYMFVKMIKMGFTEKGNSILVFPDDFLSRLLVDPAVKYLGENGSEVLYSKSVKDITIDPDGVSSLTLESGEEIKSDYYISAVPFFDFARMFSNESVYSNFKGSSLLKPSPIMSVHLMFAGNVNDIIDKDFIGVLGATIQWIFKVKDDQLCLVISSAIKEAEKEKEDIIEIAKNELFKCFPILQAIPITGSRVVKEMRATFVPDNASLKIRPAQKTKYKNFFVAGDWTDTGLPATIESAVKSSRICTEEILKNLNNN